MYDLDTIRKLNGSVINENLERAAAEGHYAVVTYTGLNAIDVDICSTEEVALALADRVRARGIDYRAEVIPPRS